MWFLGEQSIDSWASNRYVTLFPLTLHLVQVPITFRLVLVFAYKYMRIVSHVCIVKQSCFRCYRFACNIFLTVQGGKQNRILLFFSASTQLQIETLSWNLLRITGTEGVGLFRSLINTRCLLVRMTYPRRSLFHQFAINQSIKNGLMKN